MIEWRWAERGIHKFFQYANDHSMYKIQWIWTLLWALSGYGWINLAYSLFGWIRWFKFGQKALFDSLRSLAKLLLSLIKFLFWSCWPDDAFERTVFMILIEISDYTSMFISVCFFLERCHADCWHDMFSRNWCLRGEAFEILYCRLIHPLSFMIIPIEASCCSEVHRKNSGKNRPSRSKGNDIQIV